MYYVRTTAVAGPIDEDNRILLTLLLIGQIDGDKQNIPYHTDFMYKFGTGTVYIIDRLGVLIVWAGAEPASYTTTRKILARNTKFIMPQAKEQVALGHMPQPRCGRFCHRHLFAVSLSHGSPKRELRQK